MQTLTLKIEDAYYSKVVEFIQSLPKKAVKMEVTKNNDLHAKEREIAESVLQGIKDVEAGKTKDIKELLDAI
jgi:predicted patatin/cPLA2 family phospholipase